eukprot:5619975-Pleurochrysis_carterae.AAC.1
MEQMQKQQMEFQAQMQQMMQSAFATMTACQADNASNMPPPLPSAQRCRSARRQRFRSLHRSFRRQLLLLLHRSQKGLKHGAVCPNSADNTPPSAVLRKRKLAVLTACERAELAFMCERDELKRMEKNQKQSRGLL